MKYCAQFTFAGQVHRISEKEGEKAYLSQQIKITQAVRRKYPNAYNFSEWKELSPGVYEARCRCNSFERATDVVMTVFEVTSPFGMRVAQATAAAQANRPPAPHIDPRKPGDDYNPPRMRPRGTQRLPVRYPNRRD